MKAKVVIGSGYGDEGKGLFTNYFASLSKKSVVIRFNGGAQAGHTIVSRDGKRHVFGHFTANSFLNNARGYLSQHFLINPIIFLKELNSLQALGLNPVIAVHDDAYITTPYDMAINQWLEKSRGVDSRHGSCGLGIGETVHRSEIAKKLLQIKDTSSASVLKEKLYVIRDFFKFRVNELHLNDYLTESDFMLSDGLIDRFIDDIKTMKETLITGVNFLNHEYFSDCKIIFEGAQGLMLDQIMGEFPHVTRSNTGLKNVIDICKQNNILELDVLYATRCYKTRHGAGSLKNELGFKPYANIIDETNIPNEYQGSLRFAYLDIDELYEFIEKDLSSVEEDVLKHHIRINKGIGISCLDQTDNAYYYKNNNLHKIENVNFKTIFDNKEFFIKESWGPCSEDVV